ncbi:acyl-CoA dehydrogenase [Burkholderiales bacterium]|nr:acyl-CoA dehydrogenase [Burkholderiales bacterium]
MTAYRSPWSDDELDAFRDAVRRFASNVLAPREPSWQAARRVDPASWREVGAMGMLLAGVPDAYGGGGGTFAHDCVVFEELEYAGVVSLGKHVHEICAHYVLAHGTEDQKRRWLPRMARGELVGAIAMSEPSAGSDLQGVRTRAVRAGGEYVLNGSKTFISNGQISGLICVVAKSDVSVGASGISLIMVETDELAGFRRGTTLDKLGLHGQDTSELYFDDCRVPAENLLGGTEGAGFAQLMEQLPYERAIIGVVAVAAMERAVRLTTDYARERRAFGKALVDMQNTRFALAEAKTIAHVGRVFIDSCIERCIAGTLDTATASMAKWWLTDMQCRVIDECLQLHGGYGYMLEYPIARMYADARAQRIYGGTNEIMKEIIARAL